MGIGLVPSPRKPVIGDTFSTFVMLQNTGDLPTDTMLVMWKYGLNTKISYQALVEKGRRIKLRFLARASNNAQTVRLTLGDSVFQVKVLPVAKSNVTITSLDLKGNYAEEPLEISIGFFNKGSAPGKELELLFRTPTGETRVRLNTIRPAANAVHTLSWDSMTNDSFPLRIILYENAQELDSRLLHVSRTAKPRSDIILSNIAFLGGRISGAPAVFTVTIENRGNLSGLADITLDVRNPQTGKFVARKRSKRKIAAGKKTVVSTQEFALPGGLIRGEVTVAGRTEFRILDAQPFTYFPQDDENVILPSNASRFKGNIIPLKKNLSFRFPKIADISEIDSRASLIIPIRIWPSGASTSKRSSKKNKDIRVTVKPSRGASKVFIIESTDNDTSFTFNLSTQMIQKGAKVSISKKTPATVFLRGVPRFSVSLSAPENGKILSTNASDSGVSIRLKNVAKLILSNRVTLSWGYSGSEMKTKAFSLERNQMKDVFLPIRSTSAGSKKIEIELSRSPGAPRYTVNQFVLPDVIPEFELHQPIYTRHVNNGKYGTMGFLNLNGPDAIEVEISGLKRKGSSKYRTTSDTIFYNRLTEIQTAAFFMPHSEDVYLSYGSINQIASASKGKVPKVHLDILDLGGDTLILGKPGLIRYRRYADKKALPETVLYLAVNGIISTAVAIPEVLKGHVYISAIPFIPPAADSIHIMLFEKMKAQTGLNTGKTDVGIMTTARYTIGTSASLGSPSRLDWDWTRPVIIPFKDTMVFTTVYERLAEAARRAEYQLGPRNKTSDAPLSTATVLGLQTSAPDTGISARIRYRKLLRDFVLEWESAYLILSGDRLPITLSTEDVQKFHIQIEKLTEIVQTPTSVDRKMTETHLTEFAKLLEAILGMKVNRNFLTL
ncbi:MAG: hypothetical protein JKX97_06725, partial [Candidatus Lindowbacteria bacterium]|nr:hypothetical protein [Candidatus Lindowbacteria bacterium]